MLYAIGIVIAFYGGIALIGWVIGWFSRFLETQRYKRKLEQLAPQIESVNIDEVSSRLSELKLTHLSSTRLIHDRYKIREESEEGKTVDQYIQEEAEHRRAKRKPAQRKPRRRYRRYY